MDRKHRDLLRKNRLALVQDLEAIRLSNYLFQEKCFSENDLDSVRAQPTRSAQAEKLLDILPRRGPQSFDVFCRALANTDGQGYLVDLLKTNESTATGNFLFNISATILTESFFIVFGWVYLKGEKL